MEGKEVCIVVEYNGMGEDIIEVYSNYEEAVKHLEYLDAGRVYVFPVLDEYEV